MRPLISRELLVLWAGTCLFLAGCSLVRFSSQAQGLSASTILTGRISGGAPEGPIVDLDDELFSEKNGEQGYWAPRSAFERNGANVYFLEPYDPNRTPVLFVHGAAGTPQDWKYLIERLDRRRFQPWVYSFPSGAGADILSDLLYWKLMNLRARFRFETLQIAAHSMGGLVVRSFLGKYHSRFPYVRLFVSFSTPWGGEELARLAPASIHAWDDMRPGGTFLASLFERKLPSEIDFYLFFGYRGSRGLFRSRNDGTVTLKSELNLAAQAEARRVYGFAETHLSILSSREVVTEFNSLLSTHSPPRSSSVVATAK
ncbi:MAG TPA: alpha/beta hydrolase [Thermoanaerobaculia bacterium]|jgi:pimeloyl-ACP methyl ester carboxylesterase|nr:alpha/beta hydrolase [Thermoanaerobaculia bacterium]